MTVTITPAFIQIEPKVHLVPWDASSQEQLDRMACQRHSCGWDAAAVLSWAEKVLQGNKFMYWLVLDDDMQNREALIAANIKRNPTETEPIRDTATHLGDASFTPTNKLFQPIGHVALDRYPERNEVLGFDMATIWIKSLYISRALHSHGLGRAAMRETERIATQEPLNATGLALDCPTDAYQRTDEFMHIVFDNLGIERPKTVRTNQQWYESMGYKLASLPAEIPKWASEKHVVFEYYEEELNTNEGIRIPVVWMFKTLPAV